MCDQKINNDIHVYDNLNHRKAKKWLVLDEDCL